MNDNDTLSVTHGGWSYIHINARSKDARHFILDWLWRLGRTDDVLWLHNIPLRGGRELLLLARYKEREGKVVKMEFEEDKGE